MEKNNPGLPEELLFLLHVIMYETRRQAVSRQDKDWPQRLRQDILNMIRETGTDPEHRSADTEKAMS